ncbi:MAG: TonB-dependent receptor [Cytophagales bacterium]|nr:TonB-dependent receptor [Cytophagales bacterium]
MSKPQLGVKQKALAINLDKRTYGSFAEIGAGQEVAANFFKAGAASQTIAKTMSAYDMTFSDAIYGAEESGRYVVESRLVKMLAKEYSLLEIRLKEKRGDETLFFAFADTLTTINFKKDNEGHGWMGVRFQLAPNAEYNDCVLHLRMLDNDAILQQQAIGILGVNLIYACFNCYHDPSHFLLTLMEELGSDRVEIDMLRLTGPDFKHIDNRLLSLMMVKHKMTRSALFGADGNVLQPSDYFYKKNILAYRGRFRPFTLVNQDMYENGIKQFKKEIGNDEEENLVTIAELTLFNLSAAQGGDINLKDFLDRVDILGALGYTVLISDYQGYYRLTSYLSKFTRKKIGIILGIPNLYDIFNEEFYKKLPGGILGCFAYLFADNIKVYVYPVKHADGTFEKVENLKVSPHLAHLYTYLLENKRIENIDEFNSEIFYITSDKVHDMISKKEPGWETMLPAAVAHTIKERHMFGYDG